MAKKKKRSYRRRATKYVRRRAKQQPVSLLQTAGALAPAFIAYQNSGGIQGFKSDPIKGIGNVVFEYSGLSIDHGGWNPDPLLRNIVIWFATAVGSKVASKLGANRQLRRLPFVGKYIKI